MKQDRTGVRTAADLERKYSFPNMLKAVKMAEEGLTKVNNELTGFASVTVENFKKLQNEMDTKAEIWFYSGKPTLSNAPVSGWDIEAYTDHVGDLYYDTDTGYAYRFIFTSGVYGWEEVKDRDTIEALALANAASDTADSKRRVFMEQPVPPYDKGDLWLKELELYVCQTAKADGAEYEDGDFVVATKYTDDTVAEEALEELENVRVETTTNYTNAITYADKIVLEALTEYVRTGDLEEFKKTVETQFEQTSEAFTFNFTQLQEHITTVEGDLQNQFTDLRKYIRFVDGNIVLGQEDNPLTLTIRNDRIMFEQGSVEVAYFSNAKMYVTDMEATNSLTVGRLKITPRNNGNTSINVIV